MLGVATAPAASPPPVASPAPEGVTAPQAAAATDAATQCPQETAHGAHAEALAVAMASLGPDARLSHLLWLELAPADNLAALGRWLHRRGAGGIVLPAQPLAQAPWRQALQAALHNAVARAPTPLLVADLRHASARTPAHPPLLVPSWTLAAARRPALAYFAGRDVAAQLHPWGVDLVVGPSLALGPVHHHPSPRTRPFGDDPRLIGELGSWLVRGLADGGLGMLSPVTLAPAGQAAAASERAAASLVAANDAGLGGALLMAEATRGNTAAWLRPRTPDAGPFVATFHGAETGAALGQAAVAALVAGADAVLVPSGEREAVWRALQQARNLGALDSERVAQAAQRTLALRWRHPPRAPSATAAFGGAPERTDASPSGAARAHRALLARSAAAGVTVLRNRGALLPLHQAQPSNGPPRRLLVVAPAGALATRLGDDPLASVVDLPRVPSRAQRREVAEQAARLSRGADVVVMAIHNAYQREIVARTFLSGVVAPVVVVSLGPPSLLADLPRADALLCSYDAHEAGQQAAADALLGLVDAPGTLPAGLGLGGAPAP